MPAQVRFRLVRLQGDGLRLSAVPPPLTRGVLAAALISEDCRRFLLALVRQYAETHQDDADAVAARLDIEVGKPVPPLERFVGGKWMALADVPAQRERAQKIAIEGKEACGKQLCNFNHGRARKVRYEALRAATVTADLWELLQCLSRPLRQRRCPAPCACAVCSALHAGGEPMATLVTQTADGGWVPAADSPRRGDYAAASAGTGKTKPSARWYLMWPDRRHRCR